VVAVKVAFYKKERAMNMRNLFFVVSLLFCMTAYAGEKKSRTVSIVHDNAQTDMTSKVYHLKNALANDLAPFIDGAVRRNNPNSRCDRINYTAGGKQILVVSMDPLMVPYIDEMVKKLDRPAPRNEDNSTVKNAGIHNYLYRPKHRSTQAMYDVINSPIWADDGDAIFRDTESNVITWKGATTAKGIEGWLKALDRPVPQVKLTMKVYTITESDLSEVGLDYVAWKNGPGKNLFGIGFDYINASGDFEVTGSTNKYSTSSGHSNFGFTFSPQIDFSFIRMMALKGKVRVKSTGSVVVRNDYVSAPATSFADAKYRISYAPNYSSIVKDSSDDVSVTDASNLSYELYFTQPIVTFPNTTGKIDHTSAGAFGSTFSLEVSSEVGKAEGSTIGGEPIIDSQTFKSAFLILCAQEKLLASFTKQQEVEQYSGIPFLSDLPGCRNIFGSTSKSYSKVYMFVTLYADPVVPDSGLSEDDKSLISNAIKLQQAEDE